MKAIVHVSLKQGVLDPQGKAIGSALSHHGFEGVAEVRQGKYFELTLEGADRAKAEAEIARMCDMLLANTVIEDYEIQLVD